MPAMPDTTQTQTVPTPAPQTAAPPVPTAPQPPTPSAPAEASPTAPADAPAQTLEPTKEPSPGAKDWALIRAQEERLRREREELKAERKEAEEARKFREEIKRLARENPDEAGRLLGLSYDDWTRRRLSGRRTDPVAEVRAELERFKQETAAEREREKQTQAEESAKAVERHWERVNADFVSTVKGSGDRHEFLRAELEADLNGVCAVLRQMGEQNPTLTIEEAADLYERHLADRVKRYMGLPKARTMISPPAPAEAAKPSNDPPRAESGTSGGNGAVTLTNTLAQERSVTPAPTVGKNQSRLRLEREENEERIRRAMARIPV